MDNPNEISMGEYEEGQQDPPELADILDEVALQHYRRGMMSAVRHLAVWKDGQQVVGVLQTPINTVYKEILEGNWDNV